MYRTAIISLCASVCLTTAGCGGKINHANLEKVREMVNVSMATKEAIDFDAVDEILGGRGRKLDEKKFKKLTTRDPYNGTEIKIWRGKNNTWIAIQYDPKTNQAKALDGSVPSK